MADEGAGRKPGEGTAGAPPDLTSIRIWQIQAVRDVLVVAAVVALFAAGYWLRAVTVPLLVALLLAYLFEPLIVWACRHPRITRVRAVGGLVAVAMLLIVVGLGSIVPLVVGQAIDLVQDVREGPMRARLAKIEPYIPQSMSGLRRVLDLLPAAPTVETDADAGMDDGVPVQEPEQGAVALTEERVQEIVAAEIARAREGPRSEPGPSRPDWLGLAQGGLRTVVRILAALVGAALVLFLVPFYFFFFSVSYPAIARFLGNLIPERNRQRTLELLHKMDRVVAGFVRGRIIICLIMGALLAIGWMICGVPYAIVVGLVTGVFCAVPYLGAIGIPVAVGLLFFDKLPPPLPAEAAGELSDSANGTYWWLWVILFPTLVFVIVQVIEGYLLTPTIAGKATNLDPVTIIVAVLAGGSVLGVYGMLLAIPAAACLKIMLVEVFLPKLRAWSEGRAADFLPIDRV